MVIYANINILVGAHRLVLYGFPKWQAGQEFVDVLFLVWDALCGYIILGFIGILSLFGIVARIQAMLLFNDVFAR